MPSRSARTSRSNLESLRQLTPMALIWAEGATDRNALAPSWRRYARAAALARNGSLPPAERAAALVAAEAARETYDAAARRAEVALAQSAAGGKARRRVLVIGVGRYDGDARIQPLTTSVHGAWAFAEWILTGFHHGERPLGSVELLLSPGKTLGSWKPPALAAVALGLADGEDLAVEEATFANIRAAFQRWIQRAGVHPDNAAFLYFSGHGAWKSAPLLLPADARLPSEAWGADNLINIQQTQFNMFNTEPSVQCFFVDACQEIPRALLENLDPAVAEPLYKPANGGAIERVDPCTSFPPPPGAHPSRPHSHPPFSPPA